MKVLFLIDNLGSGGAQRQMTTIACLLKKKSYDVSFLVYSESNFFKQILNDNNILITTIPPSNSILRMFRIRKFIRSGDYDTVVSFMDTPNFLNCFAAIGRKKWKVITSERSSKESTFSNRRNRVYNWFQRFSDAIVCNSENARNMWKRNYPEYNEKLKVIYNAVELSNITSTYKPLNDGKLKLVVAASYQGLKNPIGLVKALTLLSYEEKNRFSIDWYGRKCVDINNGTKTYDESLDLVKKNNLEKIIHLNDSTDDIHNRMYEADFVGLFSTVEGLPNVICEGMTIGKPVIVTKVSDCEFFVDCLSGVVCMSTSAQSIAEALRKLLQYSVDDIVSRGKHSQRKANILFNSRHVSRQWEEIISR